MCEEQSGGRGEGEGGEAGDMKLQVGRPRTCGGLRGESRGVAFTRKKMEAKKRRHLVKLLESLLVITSAAVHEAIPRPSLSSTIFVG